MSAPKSILLDNDFLLDPKLRIAIDVLGPMVVARYVHLLTSLNRQGGRMPKEHARALGWMLGDDKEVWGKFLDFSVQNGLVSEDERSYFKQRLLDDAKNVSTKRKAWREKKKSLRSVSKDKQETPLGVSDLSELERNGTEEELNIKNNGALESAHPALTAACAPPEPAEMPDGTDPEVWALTENAFVPDSDPRLQRDNRYINAGRKPLKKYPDVWLTRHELADWMMCYLRRNIPKNQLDIGFKKTQSKILTYRQEGKRVQSVSAYNWGTGFILQEVLQELKLDTDLQRSEKYLRQAAT